MERLRHIIEVLTNEHGILSALHFIPVALFSVGSAKKKRREPEFMGDNAPYTLIDQLNKQGD